MTDRLIVKLKDKDNVLHCVYLNDYGLVVAAFTLQCTEVSFITAKSLIYTIKMNNDFYSVFVCFFLELKKLV